MVSTIPSHPIHNQYSSARYTCLPDSSSRCFISAIATSLSQRLRNAQSRCTLSAGRLLSRLSCGKPGGRNDPVSSAEPVARALSRGLSPAVSRKRLTEKPRYSAWTRVAAICSYIPIHQRNFRMQRSKEKRAKMYKLPREGHAGLHSLREGEDCVFG